MRRVLLSIANNTFYPVLSGADAPHLSERKIFRVLPTSKVCAETEITYKSIKQL